MLGRWGCTDLLVFVPARLCAITTTAPRIIESRVGSMHDCAGLTSTSFTVTLQQTSTSVTGLGLRLVALPQLRRARGNYKAGHKGGQY